MILVKKIDGVGNEQIDFGSLQASLPSLTASSSSMSNRTENKQQTDDMSRRNAIGQFVLRNETQGANSDEITEG
jgi:hypothetical protein